MKQRVTTWLASLALLAAVRKLMKTTSETDGYERVTTTTVKSPDTAAPGMAEPRRVTVTVRRRTEPVRARERAAAPRRKVGVRREQAPWEQLARNFNLPWQEQRRFAFPRQGKFILPRQRRRRFTLPWQRRTSPLTFLWPLLLGAALGAGLVFLLNRRRNGGTQPAFEYGGDYARLRGVPDAPRQPAYEIPVPATGGLDSAPQPTERPAETWVGMARSLAGQYEWQTGGGEIMADQWDQFCKTFGDQQRGKPVTVAARHPDGSESIIATDQPLLELSNEQDAAGFVLRLVLGSGATETLAHNISGVEGLRVQTGADGAAQELLVRTADGTTSVRFA